MVNGIHIFEGTRGSQFTLVLHAAEIEDLALDAKGALGLGGLADWSGDAQLAVDDALSIEGLTELDHGSPGEVGDGANGETPVGLFARVAVEDEDPGGVEGVADVFGDGFADPVEVGRLTGCERKG